MRAAPVVVVGSLSITTNTFAAEDVESLEKQLREEHAALSTQDCVTASQVRQPSEAPADVNLGMAGGQVAHVGALMAPGEMPVTLGTLADGFRYRNQLGMDAVLEALRLWREQRHEKLDVLLKYAHLRHAERAMRPYSEAMP